MEETLFNVTVILGVIYAIALLLYGAMFWALVKFSGKFLYLPRGKSLEKLKVLANELGLEAWKNEKGETIGWQKKSSAAKINFLIFNGRYGMALDRQYIVSMIHRIYGEQAGIFLLEYPAYGARKGIPSQDSLTEAALEGIKLLTKIGDDSLMVSERQRVEPLYIVGESLGAAVGAQVAERVPEEITGMFLIAPFNNLPDAAANRYPLFPIGNFLKEKYDSCEALKRYHGKISILVAENDHTSPARLGKKLYDCYNGPKKLFVAHQCGHNNIDYSSTAVWWKEGFDFICK